MSGPARPPAVEEYLARLERSLDGHPRDKARLLLELRDGLEDATAAQPPGAAAAEDAGVRALQPFGSVDEVAPAFQAELSLLQVRRTARAVAVTVPVLLAFWHLLFGSRASQLSRSAVLVGEHLAGLGAATAALAALTLLATGPLSRWLPVPSRLPVLVAATGLVCAATMSVAPVAMVAAAPGTTGLWPSVLVALLVAAVPLGTVATGSARCRRYATAGGTVAPSRGSW